MPGTGTVRILQDTEMRNRLSAYSHLVWNILVHHAKTWLPYGVILACLTGIWFWWDGPASDQNVVVRETKNYTDSPPPSFLHKKAGPPSKGEGKCIHSLAGIRRTKPLVDLFESPVAMETAGKEAKKEDNPEQKKNRTAERKRNCPGRYRCHKYWECWKKEAGVLSCSAMECGHRLVRQENRLIPGRLLIFPTV